MATTDTCCTVVPYFKVHEGQLDNFKQLCDQCIEQTSAEPGCLYYGFSYHEDKAHCREGYVNAEGVLNHLANIDPLLKQVLTISDLTKLEIHGPASELEKLREPLSGLNPEFWTLETGFRN